MNISKKPQLLILFFISAIFVGMIISPIDSNAEDDYVENAFINNQVYTSSQSITIITDSNFTDYQFTGTGTKEDPFLIANLSIIANLNYGLLIANVSNHVIIQNCKFEHHIEDYGKGIQVKNMSKSNIDIKDCIFETADSGVEISNSSTLDAHIFNCIFDRAGNSKVGPSMFIEDIANFYLFNTIVKSKTALFLEDASSTVIVNNNFEHSDIRISNSTCNISSNELIASSVSLYCNHSIFANNYCENEYGALVLVLRHCYEVQVTENTFINSWQHSVTFDSSHHCEVSYNLFQKNRMYAIMIFYDYFDMERSDNLVHHNSFVDNAYDDDEAYDGSSQAFDEGTNIWYDPETNEGNYWSDWRGKGNYSIDGEGGAYDPYPLRRPPVKKVGDMKLVPLTLFCILSIISVERLRKRRK